MFNLYVLETLTYLGLLLDELSIQSILGKSTVIRNKDTVALVFILRAFRDISSSSYLRIHTIVQISA